MRNFILTIILFSLSSNLHCQIIGRTTFRDEGVWSMVSVNGELPYKDTNGEGNFELKLPKTKNVLSIISDISIEIKNIPNSKKINIGEISLPMRKFLSVKEYEDLSSNEKKMCIPVNCWAQLLGYEFKNQLSEPCIKFKCKQIEYEICEFKFDVENQKIVIDWEKVKGCEK